MGWQNSIIPLLIIDASGGFTGIFIYSPTPGPGNLIGSWTAQAGTDPYGNPYPAGLNVALGSISGSVFSGTNFVLDSAGLFLYAPAH